MQRVASFSVLKTKSILCGICPWKHTWFYNEGSETIFLFKKFEMSNSPMNCMGKAVPRTLPEDWMTWLISHNIFLVALESTWLIFKNILYYFAWSSPVNPYILNGRKIQLYFYYNIAQTDVGLREKWNFRFPWSWKGLQNTLPEGTWAIVSSSHNELAWELFKRQLK